MQLGVSKKTIENALAHRTKRRQICIRKTNSHDRAKRGLNAMICRLNSLVKFKFCNEIYINLKNITRFLMVFIFFSKNKNT